jgi:hypothetical protein
MVNRIQQKIWAKNKSNQILKAVIGSDELVDRWWVSPNLAFDSKTPQEVWDTDDWITVLNYIKGQMNSDYS